MKLEDKLKQVIYPELGLGRPGIDKPHTEGVVYHLKKIIAANPGLNLDKDVLLIAAYAHDWGYADMFDAGKELQFKDVANAKVRHMSLGSQKVKKLLKDPFFNFLTSKQKERAAYLVGHHDDLDNLKDTDELVLMEADTIGGLDTNFIKPTFDRKSNEKFMSNVRERRFSKFITDMGKKEYEKAFASRVRYYEEGRFIPH